MILCFTFLCFIYLLIYRHKTQKIYIPRRYYNYRITPYCNNFVSFTILAGLFFLLIGGNVCLIIILRIFSPTSMDLMNMHADLWSLLQLHILPLIFHYLIHSLSWMESIYFYSHVWWLTRRYCYFNCHSLLLQIILTWLSLAHLTQNPSFIWHEWTHFIFWLNKHK